ncbi:MAG: hypothetical protein JW982_09310 [Spirochaetes bacterium]|nr:hypothetical protein [Spirochaetota bacterium]
MKYFFKLLIIFFLSQSAIYAGQNYKITILRFETDNLSQEIVTQITELTTSSFISYGKFEIIEREKLQKIIDQQMINMTAYSDTEKNMNAARLASVDKMISGNVNYISNKYYLNLTVTDIATGKIENASNTQFSNLNDASDTIDKAVEQLGNKITGTVKTTAYKEEKIKIPRNQTGDINFKFNAFMYYVSLASFSIMYDVNETENIMDDYKIGWSLIDLAFGKRYILIGSSLYKDMGNDETFLPLSVKIPLLIFPTETFKKNDSTYESTPAGLYLESDLAWLDTDKFKPFFDVRLTYDNGAWFNFFGSVIFSEDFKPENRYFMVGATLYLGTYGIEY